MALSEIESYTEIMGVWLALLLSAGSMRSATSSVTPIIERSVKANNRDWRAVPEYNYFERDRAASGTRTYQVLMIDGSPYQRLVALNGRAISPARRAEEQRKLDQVLAERRNESPAERAKRVAAYQKDRQRDHELLNQMVQAFNFMLLGRRRLGQRTVYVLRATPRAGYLPPNREARTLIGMQGKLWIDTQTYQWVKVEAEVVRPVWIEGFLARVEPGTRFELEYTPVSGDVWLPKHFAMKAHATILFFIPHHDQEDESYFGYEKPAQGLADPPAMPLG